MGYGVNCAVVIRIITALFIYYGTNFVRYFVFLMLSDASLAVNFREKIRGGVPPHPLAPRQGLGPWTPLGAAGWAPKPLPRRLAAHA